MEYWHLFHDVKHKIIIGRRRTRMHLLPESTGVTFPTRYAMQPNLSRLHFIRLVCVFFFFFIIISSLSGRRTGA